MNAVLGTMGTKKVSTFPSSTRRRLPSMTVTTGKAVEKDAHKADAKDHDRTAACYQREAGILGRCRSFERLSQKLIDDCIHQDCELGCNQVKNGVAPKRSGEVLTATASSCPCRRNLTGNWIEPLHSQRFGRRPKIYGDRTTKQFQ